MEWYEAEVRELVARLATPPRIVRPAVVYGSSSMRLWSTIGRDLRSDRIVNAAFGGSTLAACEYFFERIVPPLRPFSLLVYAGDNDLGDGRPPEDVLASFRRLAASVERTCGPIAFGFLAIKPSPARAALMPQIHRANALIRAEIEGYPNGYFVPAYDAMLREGEPRPELFLADGLHLSDAGYAVWTAVLEPYRERLFGSAAGSSPARSPV